MAVSGILQATLLVEALLVTTACGQIGAITPTITVGEQFAHSVEFPSRFRTPEQAKGPFPFFFDHYRFRSSVASPSVLLVAACRQVSLLEICSVNAFAIDLDHAYRTSEAAAGEWERGVDVKSLEMNDPTRRTLKEEVAKPVFLKAMPIAPKEGAETQGFRYRGNEYGRRSDWIAALTFGSSDDGALVVLSGADRRRLPDPRPAYVAAAIYTIPSGLVTLDVFAGNPSQRIAALDLDCHTSVDTSRRRVSLVDSRWLAIGVNALLDKMLLLDFKPATEPTK
jgi:hypothetical protein